MSLDIARKDTICALSSAPGSAALAIVRASGPTAHEILAAIFRREHAKITSGVFMHGEIVNAHDELIDDACVVQFATGKSFTGEPSFEIYCHGNQLIVSEILDELCRLGARLAMPGEFSLRAMLSGKIDLAQAESIADIIHAKTVSAKRVALRGVKGGLHQKCEPIRSNIVSALAEIEARMDFPDEDLGGYPTEHIGQLISSSIDALHNLLKHAPAALKLHEGARVVICGQPNAGKSTLLNALCGEDRAIVHETAGTTRDVVEAHINLGGMPIVLVDVAGIRVVDDNVVEKIGIDRAFIEIAKAHLIIWLADSTLAHPFDDEIISKALASIDTPIMRVRNKCEHHRHDFDASNISAQRGKGIAELQQAIVTALASDIDTSEIYITRARQRDELIEAQQSLYEAQQALRDGMVDEVITSELRQAGLAFDRLLGTELSEDILDRIFSQFCIGK